MAKKRGGKKARKRAAKRAAGAGTGEPGGAVGDDELNSALKRAMFNCYRNEISDTAGTRPVVKAETKESRSYCCRSKSSRLSEGSDFMNKAVYCVAINPSKLADSEEVIRQSLVSGADTFPMPGQNPLVVEMGMEVKEKAHLKKRGMKDPTGLYGYSKDGYYKDLYIYFDRGDTTSPINEVASMAFSCYGANGAQHAPAEVIRGKCYVLCLEPSASMPPPEPFTYSPFISPKEVLDTLLYFRRPEINPREIAQQRDAKRMQGMFAGFGGGFPGLYVGTGGFRPL